MTSPRTARDLGVAVVVVGSLALALVVWLAVLLATGPR